MATAGSAGQWPLWPGVDEGLPTAKPPSGEGIRWVALRRMPDFAKQHHRSVARLSEDVGW